MENLNEQLSVTNSSNSADVYGKYLEPEQLNAIRAYFQSGEVRVRLAADISTKSPEILFNSIGSYLNKTFEREGNITSRQYSRFARDLDYLLRYCTYAMLAGDSGIIDEALLKNLVQLNDVWNTNPSLLLKALDSLKTALESISNSNEISVYVDFLGSCLSISTQSSQNNKNTREDADSKAKVSEEGEADNLHSSSEKDASNLRPWESKNSREWLSNDSLYQAIKAQGACPLNLEESAKGYFESLRDLPYFLRRKIYREREITAYLYSQMPILQSIPGFAYVSVAKKTINGENRTVGIINFAPGTDLDIVKAHQNIPDEALIETNIPDISYSEKNVPIVVESLENLPISYSTKTSTFIDEGQAEIPKNNLLARSGDMLLGENRLGSESSIFTLSTFVCAKEDIKNLRPYGITVNHGCRGYTYMKVQRDNIQVRIGELVTDSGIWNSDLAESLDIALIKPYEDIPVSPYLQWVDEIPRKAIPPYSGMPVQMYGATSEHVQGNIYESHIMFPGPNPSIIPFFSVDISVSPGDSGALLVTGHFDGIPFPDYVKDLISENLSLLTYSMQGILIAALGKGDKASRALFRPMITILQWMEIKLFEGSNE